MRDDAGKEHARHFERKVDAQQWLDEVTAAVVRGDYVDPTAGRPPCAAYAGRWEAVQVSSAGTKRIVDNALRLHLLPALGGRRDDVCAARRRPGVREVARGEGARAGSVRNIYDVTAQVFAAAVDDRVIPSSPCRKITLPQGRDGRGRAAHAGAGHARRATRSPSASRPSWSRWRARACGSASCSASRVVDVDFLRRTIRVERQRMQSGELAPVKSKTSRRTVPVGQVVIDQLAAHLAKYPSDDVLFTDELGRAVDLPDAGRCCGGTRPPSGRRRRRRPTTCGTSSPRP